MLIRTYLLFLLCCISRSIFTHSSRYTWKYWCNCLCHHDAEFWSDDSRSYLFNPDSFPDSYKVSVICRFLVVKGDFGGKCAACITDLKYKL